MIFFYTFSWSEVAKEKKTGIYRLTLNLMGKVQLTNAIQILICSYDSTTGVFTVPPGGDGVYYFSTYLLVNPGEAGLFDMKLNDDVICTTYPDQSDTTDLAPGSCSAVVDVVAGEVFKIHCKWNKISYNLWYLIK